MPNPIRHLFRGERTWMVSQGIPSFYRLPTRAARRGVGEGVSQAWPISKRVP
jgi:hypothetical protein